MNELALTLAEKLDIAFESAVELLPVIQEQFIYHEIIESFNFVLTTIFSLSAIAVFISFLAVIFFLRINMDDDYLDEDEERYYKLAKKTLKYSSIVFLGCLVVDIVLKLLTVLLAPQYLMLLEVLN